MPMDEETPNEATTLDRRTLVARARTMFESDADGEIVALCPDTSNCFGFNDTASELWRLLKTPQTLGALVEQLTARFDVDADTCARDVSTALLWMEGEGLVSLDRPAP
jgi:hypothetical protein